MIKVHAPKNSEKRKGVEDWLGRFLVGNEGYTIFGRERTSKVHCLCSTFTKCSQSQKLGCSTIKVVRQKANKQIRVNTTPLAPGFTVFSYISPWKPGFPRYGGYGDYGPRHLATHHLWLWLRLGEDDRGHGQPRFSDANLAADFCRLRDFSRLLRSSFRTRLLAQSRLLNMIQSPRQNRYLTSILPRVANDVKSSLLSDLSNKQTSKMRRFNHGGNFESQLQDLHRHDVDKNQFQNSGCPRLLVAALSLCAGFGLSACRLSNWIAVLPKSHINKLVANTLGC